MATELIRDTTIVTADDAGSILSDAALVVRDRRIAALGPTPELLRRFPDAAIVAEAERIARAAWRRLFERRPELPRPPGLDVGTR
jgi:hypothetical protein